MQQIELNIGRYQEPKGRKLSRRQLWWNDIDQYLGKGKLQPQMFWYWANRNGEACINRIIAEMKDKEANPSARPIRVSRVALFLDECKRHKTDLKTVET